MITINRVKEILFNELLDNEQAVEQIAFALEHDKRYPYYITTYSNISVIEFIYICYILNFDLANFIPEKERLSFLYNKAEVQNEINQLKIDIYQSDDFTELNMAEDISKIKKEYITPIEDTLLYAFREVGKKHGETTQQAIIEMIHKML